METYSIINDFGGVTPNISQLNDEIQNSSIVTICNGVSLYQDDVFVYFVSSISGPEKVILDALVSAHIPNFQPTTDKRIDLHISKNTKKTTYSRMATTTLPVTTFAKADCIGYRTSDATSYSILIFDKNNKNILLETTLTNTEEGKQQLGVLTNLPTDESQIEISLRRNGGSSTALAYLESVVIHYL